MFGIIWTDFTNILFSSPSMVESLTRGLPKVPKGFPEVKKCNYQYSEKVQLRVWLAEENAKQTTSLWGCACQPGRDLKRPFIKIFGELVQCVTLMYFWHRSKKRKRFEWEKFKVPNCFENLSKNDHFRRNLSWIGPMCTVTLMYFWHHSKKRKQLK